MEADGKRTMALIKAEIMNQGPFLPRSVRRDYRKYRDKKGRLHTYEVQSRVNVRLGDRRVPKEMFDQVRKLTDNYRRFKELVLKLEEAAGGQAGERNANVICAGEYEHVGGDGRPLFTRRPIRYHVTGAGGAALGAETWRVAEQEGAATARRVVFVSDGERELEAVFQEHFEALPNITRILDSMHACQYVDILCKGLEKNAERAAAVSLCLRRRLVSAGRKGFAASFARRFGEEVRKAWVYLTARTAQMDYRNFRRRGLPIGSGMAEARCKLNLGRLKGPGMYWRSDNGIKIALLRATLRSGMVITA